MKDRPDQLGDYPNRRRGRYAQPRNTLPDNWAAPPTVREVTSTDEGDRSGPQDDRIDQQQSHHTYEEDRPYRRAEPPPMLGLIRPTVGSPPIDKGAPQPIRVPNRPEGGNDSNQQGITSTNQGTYPTDKWAPPNLQWASLHPASDINPTDEAVTQTIEGVAPDRKKNRLRQRVYPHRSAKTLANQRDYLTKPRGDHTNQQRIRIARRIGCHPNQSRGLEQAG